MRFSWSERSQRTSGARTCDARQTGLLLAAVEGLLRRAGDEDLARPGFGVLVGVDGEHALVELRVDLVRIDRVTQLDRVLTGLFATLAGDRERTGLEGEVDVIGVDARHVDGDGGAIVAVLDVHRRREGRPHDLRAGRLPGDEVIEETHGIPADEGPEASAIAVWSDGAHWNPPFVG